MKTLVYWPKNRDSKNRSRLSSVHVKTYFSLSTRLVTKPGVFLILQQQYIYSSEHNFASGAQKPPATVKRPVFLLSLEFAKSYMYRWLKLDTWKYNLFVYKIFCFWDTHATSQLVLNVWLCLLNLCLLCSWAFSTDYQNLLYLPSLCGNTSYLIMFKLLSVYQYSSKTMYSKKNTDYNELASRFCLFKPCLCSFRLEDETDIISDMSWYWTRSKVSSQSDLSYRYPIHQWIAALLGNRQWTMGFITHFQTLTFFPSASLTVVLLFLTRPASVLLHFRTAKHVCNPRHGLMLLNKVYKISWRCVNLTNDRTQTHFVYS